TPSKAGPPGPNDSADASSATLTLGSQSVMQLQGTGMFDAEGQFTAGTLAGSPTVIGSGALNAGSVIDLLYINGGHVVAGSFTTSETVVEGGGTLTVQGLCTDHPDFECNGVGSSINAQSGMTDVGLVVGAGGHVTAASIQNEMGSSSTFQGDGALVSVTGHFWLAEGATLDL